MSEAACAFEQVPLKISCPKQVPVAGVLEAQDDLEEMPVLGESHPLREGCERVRAFRVRRDIPSVGLQAGDCLLVQPKRVAPDELAVVSIDGGLSVRRVVARFGERLAFEPACPLGVTPRVIGGFAGILRRRSGSHTSAFGQRETSRGAERQLSDRVRALKGSLGMVESTCAETANPRLKRALRHEAEKIRRQLQSEAARN